ncbi:MAG: mechanosensitive ion channel family protein [Acidobacteriota bacterium]|jgi:MscS family membrane protein
MEELLSRAFYGNTVLEWAIAFAIIIGAFLAGKILYWVSGTLIRRLTRRTKTRLDDILIDMVEEPAVFALTVAGVWYGLHTLEMPDRAQVWIGNVVQFLVVLAVAWMVTRILDAIYREYLVPIADKTENDLDDQLLPILQKGTKLAVWSIGLIVALNNAGYDVGALIAGLGIGGLALAMAAKDTVSNIFGGFTIFSDRPFKLTDRIKVAGYDGTVTDIGVRSTRLTTLEGRVVTIPNSTFSGSAVENVSMEPSRKVVLNLGLTYDTTPEQMQQAMTLLKDIAAGNDGAEENVLVGFNAFGDSSMNIIFIYYIKKSADILGTQTEMNMKILEEFARAGLDFAFPTQTLYTKQVA